MGQVSGKWLWMIEVDGELKTGATYFEPTPDFV